MIKREGTIVIGNSHLFPSLNHGGANLESECAVAPGRQCLFGIKGLTNAIYLGPIVWVELHELGHEGNRHPVGGKSPLWRLRLKARDRARRLLPLKTSQTAKEP